MEVLNLDSQSYNLNQDNNITNSQNETIKPEKTIFKGLREKIICDYQPALIVASKERVKPATFEERKLFFNIVSNRLEFRKVPWDLFTDYGFYVYVGELDLEDSDVTTLCNSLVLDSLFENYLSRDRLSIFPEIVDKNDIFGTIMFADKFDFVYRGRNGGFKYLPNISEKLHEVCSEKIKDFVSTGDFFREIPDLFIQKNFILPGWTPELIIQVLKQGKNLISSLELIQFGINLGYMISRDENFSSEIIKEIDDIASDFVKEEIFYDKSRTDMLRGAGYKWLFSGLPLSQSQIKDLFPKLKSVCSEKGVSAIGEKETF